MEQKKQSFMQALDEFIRPNRQGYLFSVLTSILGVACSIVPYICAGQIITELIQGQTSVQKILPWVLFALAGYLRRWTKGYRIKQPNMDCQPTEITALMRHRAVFS